MSNEKKERRNEIMLTDKKIDEIVDRCKQTITFPIGKYEPVNIKYLKQELKKALKVKEMK